MRFPLLFVALVAMLPSALSSRCFAMAKKPEITVRIHTEADKNDSDTFSIPVNLIYQQRQAYLSKVADISERMIEKILPFPARDGSWGCVLKLNPMGRIRLENMSGQLRGNALVIFVTTKMGNHQVADMIVDRVVTDGIITIPRGLNEIEVALLRQKFKILGETVKQNLRDHPKDKPLELPGGHFEPPADRNAAYEAISSKPPARNRRSSELDLPRLSD